MTTRLKLLLSSAAVCILLTFTQSTVAAEVQVSIDGASKSHTIHPMIQGHGLSYSMEADAIYSSGAMAQLFKDVGAGFLRWPGGTPASKYHWNDLAAGWVDNWDPDYPKAWDPEPETYMDLDEYIALTRSAGTEPMLGINMSSGMEWNREADGLNEAIALVQYCLDNNFDVKYFYLDNESYHDGNGYNEDKGENGGEWTPALYGEKFNLYAVAIKQLVPDAILFANWKEHIRSNVDEYTTMINIAGDNIDYMDVHWYWKWGEASWDAWKAKTPMENETDWYDGGTYVEETEFFNNLAASLGKPHIKLASLEWNIAPGDHNTNPSHTPFMTGLMGAEMQMQFMQAGIEVAAMWTAQWPDSSTAEFQFLVNSDENHQPAPMASVFELYKYALNGTVIASTSSKNDLMTVTVDKGDKVYTYLLNKSDSDQIVTFDFSGVSILSVAEALRFATPGQLFDVYPWLDSGKHKATVAANSLVMVAFNKDMTQNLVANGDFESGIDGWAAWNNPVVTTDAYNGSNAIKIVDSGSINQDVSVQPNTTYTLSVYAKVTDGSEKVVIGVDAANGNRLAVTDVYNTQYTLKELTFTTDANTTSLNIWIWQPQVAGVSSFVDKLVLLAGDTSTGPDDTTPPTPNPASFSSAPTAISDSAITMTATTGSDSSGGVQYLFTETTGGLGATNSAWQTSATYTDSGLSASTTYSYSVQMRDSLGNTGNASAIQSATTTDEAPSVNLLANGSFENALSGWATWNNPTITTDAVEGSSAIQMIDESSINLDVTVEPNTTYTLSAYLKTNDGLDIIFGVDNSAGRLAITKVLNTQYTRGQLTFTTVANTTSVNLWFWLPSRANVTGSIDYVTLFKAGGTDTTPPTPDSASFASQPATTSASAITMTATTGSDPSGTVLYLFSETSGNPGGASSGWQSTPSYTNSGLSANTHYTYTVTLRDAFGNTGNPSSQASATTWQGSLVVNGSFQLGLDNWHTWNNPVITTDAYKGNAAVQIVDQGSVGQWIDVEPLTTYKLSAYVKTSDSSKRIVLGINGGPTQATDMYNTAYTYVELTFTTNSSTTSIEVYCWLPESSGASAFIDKVKLVKQ